MSKVYTALSMVTIVLLTFTATAFASGAVVPEDGSLFDLAKPILEAVRSGQYAFAASAALVFAVALARKYGAKRYPWLVSDAGGATLTLVGAFGGAVSTALAAGATLSAGLAWTATGVAVAAAGGYSLIKKLLVDPMVASAWYKERAPSWLKSVMGVVLWVFVKPDVAAKATEAGDQAVTDKPSTGTDGVVGKPLDF